MTEEEREALGKALVALEMHRAEIRMLSTIVTGLCGIMPDRQKEGARSLISKYADLEPKYVIGDRAREDARMGITRLASSWIATLTP